MPRAKPTKKKTKTATSKAKARPTPTATTKAKATTSKAKAKTAKAAKPAVKKKAKAAATKPKLTAATFLQPRKPGETRYWLMKTEPEAYSITDLERDRRADWDGVRSYQARNFMRDEMAVGDAVLFYHSNAEPAGIAGLARVSRQAAPDVTALDPESKYYDPKATEAEPRWYCVEVEHVATFARTVSLAELRETPGLEHMLVLQRGQRLSILPVSQAEYEIVRRLAQA